ncbi:non-canonical purine NTP pyrophosphatase, partial [Candidatus Pelagibacter sp.]|nr:non-canonical purine NTP pyrophosphatase [Candidatus Pelagibacter sp.]
MLKNKIIKLLVGTNNKGKLKEIKDLLPKNLEIYSPKDFKMKSPAENGKTFEENSLIKAKFFSKKSKMLCLSDDSGLEIDTLNGDPGIYSARWGGKKGDFKRAMNRVFKELDKKDKDWRQKK